MHVINGSRQINLLMCIVFFPPLHSVWTVHMCIINIQKKSLLQINRCTVLLNMYIRQYHTLKMYRRQCHYTATGLIPVTWCASRLTKVSPDPTPAPNSIYAAAVALVVSGSMERSGTLLRNEKLYVANFILCPDAHQNCRGDDQRVPCHWTTHPSAVYVDIVRYETLPVTCFFISLCLIQ